jgi:hypothetical protein
MTTVEEIENSIKKYLLTDIVFLLEQKKLKQGKLLLFSVRDFYCIFTLLDTQKNKKIIYEIPYPFNLNTTKNSIEFNYTIESFAEKCKDIDIYVTAYGGKKTSKLFNKKLVIQLA